MKKCVCFTVQKGIRALQEYRCISVGLLHIAFLIGCWKNTRKSWAILNTHEHAAAGDSSGLILMIPMWFIQQIQDQFVYIFTKKIIINWPNKPYLCLCFPTVLFERRMNKGTLSQRTLEKWHISSGIIVLCVSVAHFSFILMLSCTQMTNSCITCKGLSKCSTQCERNRQIGLNEDPLLPLLFNLKLAPRTRAKTTKCCRR